MRYIAEKAVPLALERAWDVFSDTDHLNRFVGLPPVLGSDQVAGVKRTATARVMGLKVAWIENPFEWVEGQYWSITREYTRGPVALVVGRIEFVAIGTGTLMRFVADVRPRNVLTTPIAALVAWRTVHGFGKYVAQYLAKCEGGELRREFQLPARTGPAPTRAPTNTAELTAMLNRIIEARPTHETLLRKFEDHLLHAGDDEVLRMRPYQLAADWREGRQEVLEFFLHATKVGLLRLDWELICPYCRVPKAEFGSLREVTPTYHCDLCGINYVTDLEEATELRFSVVAEVRAAEDAVFCLGSPAKTPHVAAQQFVRAGEDRKVKVRLESRAYRVRAVRLNRDCRLKPMTALDSESQARVDIAFADHGWSSAEIPFGPGEVEFNLRNHAAEDRLFVVERVGPDPFAVTAAEVTTMQEFRDLFSAEVLAPGQQIGVRSLCVLFTDLKQSTELYEAVGDATAFGRVHRHFDFITAKVSEHRGAVIKTIGDSVMAVFPTRHGAVAAALELQRQLPRFNAENAFVPPLVLKMGLHFGAAIVVNANGKFDYFGRTVNIAARLQTHSVGNDVVMTDEVISDPGVRALLEEAGGVEAAVETSLKGFESKMKLWRIQARPLARAVG